jgi:hypothetical protein
MTTTRAGGSTKAGPGVLTVRVALLAVTMATLATALLAGLSRLGWGVPFGAAHATWAIRLLVATAIVLAGAPAAWIWHRASAARLAGAALVAIAAWLVRFDLARRLIRQPALPRYVAVAVLSGAAWLGIAGIQLALSGLPQAGPRYDAAIQAVFVGFVLSMVMAHAPIVVPVVVGVRLPFRRLFCLPLVLLHASLAVRIVEDWAELVQLRRLAGLGNTASLVLLVAVGLAARTGPADSGARRRPG